MTRNKNRNGKERKCVTTIPTYFGSFGQRASQYRRITVFKIINRNVLTTRALRKESVDLIVTSPLDNVNIDYNADNDLLSYGTIGPSLCVR